MKQDGTNIVIRTAEKFNGFGRDGAIFEMSVDIVI